jgi:low temperature requirement protein LtrA
VFVALALLEMLVPVWAERPARTPWHAEHIAERYGLFVIIVLGECVLGTSAAVQRTLSSPAGLSADLAITGIGGLVLLFALWWLYFLRPFPNLIDRDSGRQFWWGYVHYGVFAALAALGAGLEVAADSIGHDEEISRQAVAWAVCVPVAAFVLLLSVLGVVVRMATPVEAAAKVVAAAVVLVIPALDLPVPWLVLAVAAPVVALDARGVWQQHAAHRLAMQDARSIP